MKKRIYNVTDQEFTTTRKNLTTGVYGVSLIPDELSKTRVTLTKVEPNGVFSTHIDNYHHIFYFLQGHGIGYLDEEEYSIEPGLIVEIPAGTPHGYRNTSQENMLLITMNIPP
jgi:mannose-6-phosphate isomerase-like protein (cupin superfamily)